MVSGKLPILILVAGYLPGFSGGGPIRSIANLVEILGDELDFKIITLDRDLGSSAAYPGIRRNEWQRVGKAEVFYISPDKISWSFVRRLINSTAYDVLYLNSFFSPGFTILPLLLQRLGLIGWKKAIIAPRGEFSQGALKLKSFKKGMYIHLAKLVGLCRNVVWHASNQEEMNDIKAVFEKAQVSLASNLVVVASHPENSLGLETKPKGIDKKPGNLKVVFLSRISPKKNLEGALRLLSGVKGDILFNIYGPLEDRGYWEKCQRIIATLPVNIEIRYKGSIGHDAVTGVFSENHLFLFPTQGENFGHVIIEALLAGCPVLISDHTPWLNLEEKGVGWDLPLSRPERFVDVLQRCVDMDQEEYQALSQRARAYSTDRIHDYKVIQDNHYLFTSA